MFSANVVTSRRPTLDDSQPIESIRSERVGLTATNASGGPVDWNRHRSLEMCFRLEAKVEAEKTLICYRVGCLV